MTTEPLVTINILSYNRKEELRNTLNKVYEQDYKNIEVIVVDNASTDGTVEMINNEFAVVNLIELEKNTGVLGWNEGLLRAKGEYVLILDDDAYPNANSILLSVMELQNNPLVACVAFNLIDMNTGKVIDTKWLPKNKSNLRRYWPIFIGCAIMVKMDRIKKEKFIPPGYFLYQHELPVAAEIYNSGYKIIFNAEITATHKFKYHYSNESDILIFKNNLKFINEYLPSIFNHYHTFHLMLFYFSRALRYKWFGEYLKASFNYKKQLSKRNPISIKYYLQLRRLRIFNISLVSKVFKHL